MCDIKINNTQSLRLLNVQRRLCLIKKMPLDCLRPLQAGNGSYFVLDLPEEERDNRIVIRH